MAQSTAHNYSADHNTDDANGGQEKTVRDADSVSQEARNLVDRVVAYAKDNPIEATAIAAGLAFVVGAAILGPRLVLSREERNFDRLMRRAYREVDRVRDKSFPTWNRLTEWAAANVPSVRTK